MALMRANPKTSAEWQKAVDGAAGLRAIADCIMYGLLKGGVNINIGRCDWILKEGKKRGVLPSKPATSLAIDFIEAINAEAEGGD